MIERARQWIIPVLVVVMGLQMLRLMVGSLVWYLGDTLNLSTLSLTPFALVPFLLAFLAAPLWRAASPRGALWISAGGLALLRVVEQIVTDPGIDLWLSMAGVAAFALFFPVYFGHLRATTPFAGPPFAYGTALGFATDTALRGAFGTVDLTWLSGATAVVVTVAISVTTLWALWKEPAAHEQENTETDWLGALVLIAIGPFLLLELLIFQSQGLLGELGRIGPSLSFLIVMLGNVLLLMGVFSGFTRPQTFRIRLAFAAGMYLTLAVLTASVAGPTILLTALLAQYVLGWGWALVGTRASPAERKGLGRTGLTLPFGTLLFVVLAFVFYVSLMIALPFPRQAVLPAATILLGLLYLLATRGLPATEPTTEAGPVWVAGALVAVPLAVWVISGPPPEPDPNVQLPVKIMTYNIHSGFGSLGRHDPEAIAQVIEGSGADIVALQEVARVRLVDGGTDLATWLSRRLDMPIVFYGTEEPHWGNAILTRLPILNQGSGTLPRDGSLLGRGYTWVELEVGLSDPLLVIDTHLHQIEEDSHIRLEQVPVLLEFWDGRPRMVLLGDLNATPETPEMGLLYEAGLVDSWLEAGEGDGFTSNAVNPHKRIDWIWHTADLAGSDAEVLQTLASDHLPVVITAMNQ